MKSVKYNNYKDMKESSLNWEYLCAYQLLPTAMEGEHKIVFLDTIQLSYTYRVGGMMHNALSPKNMVSVAVIHECKDKACFNNMKIKKGDILFFDDTHFIDFMSNNVIQASIVSLPKKEDALTAQLLNSMGFFMHNIENPLAPFLLELSTEEVQTSKYKSIEAEIKNILLELLKKETLKEPKLTKSAKIALKIRERFYKHMDIKIDIKSLSLEYGISEQSLQNGFKSLFGFTPKLFLRQLKLNHVHHDLLKASPNVTKVSKIAHKWGFRHMGHFSHYYKELFKENPSITLEKQLESVDGITDNCALRVEEM